MSRRSWLLVLLFVISLPAVTSRLYASDEIEYYAFLRSLWFDRDVSFDNEYRYFYEQGIARGPGFRETFLEMSTPTGLRLNFGTIGSALLWSPMYLVADVSVRLARAAGADVAADGYSRPYIAAIAYGSALYGFLAVLLSSFIARRVVGRDGDIAALVVWVGTPLPFYMYLAPGMAHACSAFAVAVFVAVWLRVRERWSAKGMAALGALAAVMTMVREQDAFIVAGVALDYLWWIGSDWPRTRDQLRARLAGVVAGIMAFIVVFMPQAWAYVALNGRLGPARVVSDKMRWWAPHAGQVLFSPEHGLFAWTPLALLCAVGLVALALGRYLRVRVSDGRRLALCFLVMIAAQVYISGSVDTWTVAGSFGQRRFLGLTVAFVVGLTAILSGAAALQRRAAWVGVVLSVWWNLGLMVQFGAGWMDRQRLDLPVNAYNTFIRVPLEMPSVAYRYFFDRSSFYKPPS